MELGAEPLKRKNIVTWDTKKQNPKRRQKQKPKSADEDGQTELEGNKNKLYRFLKCIYQDKLLLSPPAVCEQE